MTGSIALIWNRIFWKRCDKIGVYLFMNKLDSTHTGGNINDLHYNINNISFNGCHLFYIETNGGK